MSWQRALLVNGLIAGLVSIVTALMGAPFWGAWMAGMVVYFINVAADRVVTEVRKVLAVLP